MFFENHHHLVLPEFIYEFTRRCNILHVQYIIVPGSAICTYITNHKPDDPTCLPAYHLQYTTTAVVVIQ